MEDLDPLSRQNTDQDLGSRARLSLHGLFSSLPDSSKDQLGRARPVPLLVNDTGQFFSMYHLEKIALNFHLISKCSFFNHRNSL